MFRLLSRSVLVLFLTITLSSILFSQSVSAQDCQQSERNEGLISALSKTADTDFGNINQECVTGSSAIYREWKVPTYLELEEQFYYNTKSQPPIKKDPDTLPLNSQGILNFSTNPPNGIYLKNSSLSVDGANGTGAQVIFVKGDLNILGNITYGANDPNSGLVFIVSGKININWPVTDINAVLISEGKICTAYDFSAPAASACRNQTTPPLKIYGSLISINKSDLSAPGEQAITFSRSLANNLTSPAEEVIKQAKYLTILKNGLFTKDLVITEENKHFAIDPASYLPPPPPPPPPGPPATETSCSTNPIVIFLNLAVNGNCDIP